MRISAIEGRIIICWWSCAEVPAALKGDAPWAYVEVVEMGHFVLLLALKSCAREHDKLIRPFSLDTLEKL